MSIYSESSLLARLSLGDHTSLGSTNQGLSNSIPREEVLVAQSVNTNNNFPSRPPIVNPETASEYFQAVAACVAELYLGAKGFLGDEKGAVVRIAANNLPKKDEFDTLEEWVDALSNVQNERWFERVAVVGSSSATVYDPTGAAINSIYNIAKAEGPVGRHLEHWANRPPTSYSQSVPSSSMLTPARVVEETLHQSTQDYLNNVRSRLILEKGLDDILAGDMVVLPATSAAGIQQWQKTFGNDVAYNPELVQLLFKQTQGANGQIKSEAVAPEEVQYSGNNEQLRKTLEWYQKTDEATRKRFLDALLLTVAWEEAVENERAFLSNRADPLAASWDSQVPRESEQEKQDQRTNILGSLEQHDGHTGRSQALNALVGQQIVGDIRSGPGNAVLLEQREIEALKALHSSFGISTPFEDLSPQQAVALVDAALYLGRHWGVVEAEAKGDAAEVQRLKAIRDDAKAVPDLSALGISSDAAIEKLQGISPALMNQEDIKKELVDVASVFNFQGPLVERLLDIFALRASEVW